MTSRTAAGARPAVAAPRAGWWARHQRLLTPYLFIAPNLLVFGVFMLIPLLFAVYMSFQNWSIVGTPEYAGADNYTRMVGDELFWQSLRQTAIYTLGTVPTSIALGLGAAMLLNRPMPGRALLRSVFFVPVIISGVATALIAAWIFNDNYGILNALIKALGGDGVQWLSSTTWAMPALIITTLWIRLGFCMVIYLAALQSIPEDLHQAARVDGATSWFRFRTITWPLLGPTTFLLVVINVIFSFHVFDLIYVMTGGGPGFSTTVLVQYIYEAAFTNAQMGYASAMGLVLYAILLVFTLVYWRLSRQGQEA